MLYAMEKLPYLNKHIYPATSSLKVSHFFFIIKIKENFIREHAKGVQSPTFSSEKQLYHAPPKLKAALMDCWELEIEHFCNKIFK